MRPVRTCTQNFICLCTNMCHAHHYSGSAQVVPVCNLATMRPNEGTSRILGLCPCHKRKALCGAEDCHLRRGSEDLTPLLPGCLGDASFYLFPGYFPETAACNLQLISSEDERTHCKHNPVPCVLCWNWLFTCGCGCSMNVRPASSAWRTSRLTSVKVMRGDAVPSMTMMTTSRTR